MQIDIEKSLASERIFLDNLDLNSCMFTHSHFLLMRNWQTLLGNGSSREEKMVLQMQRVAQITPLSSIR
jgi:hypothetical protein